MPYVSILNNVSQSGGLPIVANFAVPANTGSLALLVSGSGWSQSASTTLQIQVLIGQNVVATMQSYCNPAYTHRTFGTAFIPLSLAAGTYTLTLREVDGGSTMTDQNDYFSAMLLA